MGERVSGSTTTTAVGLQTKNAGRAEEDERRGWCSGVRLVVESDELGCAAWGGDGEGDEDGLGGGEDGEGLDVVGSRVKVELESVWGAFAGRRCVGNTALDAERDEERRGPSGAEDEQIDEGGGGSVGHGGASAGRGGICNQ